MLLESYPTKSNVYSRREKKMKPVSIRFEGNILSETHDCVREEFFTQAKPFIASSTENLSHRWG